MRLPAYSIRKTHYGFEAGRILIVEDEDSVRLSFRNFHRRRGPEVSAAFNGVGASKWIPDNEVDIINSDVRGGDYRAKSLVRFCRDKKVILTSGFPRLDFKFPFEVAYKLFDYAELELKQTRLAAEAGDESGR